ncbi:MAG: beta-propeller fold lactonase family protein [Acidobacteria bacterium]|nr:beta-propeller fold lactonase family protein [Acidobacteriota bacterium]
MKPHSVPVLLFILAILLALTTSCGTTTPLQSGFPPGQSFVYVANDGSQTISGFKRDITTGALTPVQGSPFAADVEPGLWSSSLAVDPKNLMLFALGHKAPGGQLSVYLINSDTGALAPAAGSPFNFPAACSTRSISVDPTGRFVYVGTQCAGILAWQIDRRGRTLVPVPGSPFGNLNAPYNATVDTAGKYLYAAEYTNGIETFAIDQSTGSLQLVNGPFYIPHDGPKSIIMHPSGNFAYVMGDANDLSLELWVCAVIPSDGAVSALERQSGGVPLLALAPDAKFLFTSIGTYGTLTGQPNLSGSYSAEPLRSLLPSAAAVTPDNRFVFATVNSPQQSAPGTLSVFRLDETTGALTPIPGSPYSVGAQPTAVAVTH